MAVMRAAAIFSFEVPVKEPPFNGRLLAASFVKFVVSVLKITLYWMPVTKRVVDETMNS